ncbi:MAG: OmpH family outer membrane protein [Acidobacteriota bacterium]
MKRSLVFALAAIVSVPLFAQTPPARIAVINVQKVLQESTAGKAALEGLKKVQDQKAAQAKKMQDDLTSIEGQINSKQLSLSQDKLAELNKQFTDKKVALQRYAQDADRELQEARDRSLADLEQKIMPVIQDLGKEMGFAVIFNKFESGLVYASDAVDITDTVIKRFNDAQTKAPAK